MADIEKLRTKMNKDFDADIIIPSKEMKFRRECLSSGVADIDLRLRGGWPVGTLNLLYGAQSSGKSLIAMLTIAKAQRTCRKCYTLFNEKVKCECKKCDPCRVLYIDAENYWTNEWAAWMGIKPEDVYVARPRYMEEAFDIVDVFIREEAVDLIVLDSFAALSPKAEKEAQMEEWQQALAPRVFRKFLRKWASDLSDLRAKDRQIPTTLFLNQITKKTGVVYGNPEILPGGDAQLFFSTTILKVYKKGIEMSCDKDDPQPMYQSIRFVVEKSKSSPVKMEGTFEVAINKYMDSGGVLHKPGDIANDRILFDFAKRFNLVDQKPGKYVMSGKEFKTQDELFTALREDTAFFRDVFRTVNLVYTNYVPTATSMGGRKKGDEKAEGEGTAAAS